MKAVRTGTSGKRGPGERAIRQRARSQSLARATLICLTVALIVGPFAVTGKAASCSSLEPEDWVAMDVPAFSEGSQAISDFDVAPRDPRLLFVTNGRGILSSTDAGCSFKEVFSLGSWSEDYVSDAAEITDLLVASADGRRVYATVSAREDLVLPPDLLGNSSPDQVDRPHVIVSRDGGGSWAAGDDGLDEAFGRPLSIAATPGSETAYLLVDEAEMGKLDPVAKVKQGQSLWASTTGGAAWVSKPVVGSDSRVDTIPTPNPAQPPPPLWKGLQSDPVDDQAFWIYGEQNSSGALRKSTDGGGSFMPDTLAGAYFINGADGVETFYPPDGPTEVIGIPTGMPQVFFSVDAGISYRPWEEPGQVQSVAITSPYSFAAATVDGDVHFTFPAVADPMDISYREPIRDLKAVAFGDSGLIYGRTANAILRRVAPQPPPAPKVTWPSPAPLPDDFTFPPFDPMGEPPPPVLRPSTQSITLRPGETRTIQYQLMIPGAIKADIGFLLDTSGSMVEELEGLKKSINAIREALGAEDIYAYAGAADYKSFKAGGYVLRRDIGPMDHELERALGDMNAGGGDSETGLAALYSLATGEGRVAPSGQIAPGQDMHFRPDALHFVVHGTDEDPDPTPPNPSFQEVSNALRNKSIRHIGLAYENSGYGPYLAPPPTTTLGTISTETYATVPEGIQVDCTGDGQYTDPRDLLPGEALVCAIPSENAGDGNSIGTAIAEMVKSVPDLRTVSLQSSGQDDVILDIAPPQHHAINFKVEQMVPFDVVVQCPTDRPDDEYPIDLDAFARGVSIADAELEVVCQSIEDEPFHQPPDAAQPLLGIPPILPPPPRPPNLSQPVLPQSPVQQVQAQQQAQQQMQAQAGLVPQRQEQPQVAAVKVMKPSANLARADSGSGDDLSFSSYQPKKHGDPPLYLFTWVIGAAVGSAFGLIVRARARRQYVVARARNRQRAKRTLRHWN